MNIKLRTVGSIKIKGNPKTRSIIIQTLRKVFGAHTNGFIKIQREAVTVFFPPQKEVEFTKFADQFLGKIQKGNYFFDEIETPEQKLSLLLDIGETVDIQGPEKGKYEPSIYPNHETRIYVNAMNKRLKKINVWSIIFFQSYPTYWLSLGVLGSFFH